MLITFILLILALAGVALLRRKNTTPQTGRLVAESLLTTSSGFFLALVIWQLAHFVLSSSPWLTGSLWLVMFIAEVVAVRALGGRFTQLAQNDRQFMTRFTMTLAYHTGVFWKLLLAIIATTALTQFALLADLQLILGFLLTIAISLESSVRLFQLDHISQVGD